MRRILLSLIVLGASGGYVWSQSLRPQAADAGSIDLPDPLAEPAAAAPAKAEPPALPVVPVVVAAADPQPKPQPVFNSIRFAARRPAEAPPAKIEQVADATTPAAPVQKTGAFADGSYDGKTVNAYYGLLQLRANIKGGKLVSVKVLQYPNDRRTSVAINRQALPMLAREAIAAQGASVDVISGATFTSHAYIRSLASAMTKAKG